ncbi:MAG: ribonuclease HII [Candidatus Pacearchaeota archaeon]|nr:ribonuclease HII [Candidatus Pacearchaeota archaeon]
MLVHGIDEAGRGSCLGPLVLAGATFDEKDIQKLRELGVKDSKLLLPKQRERLFEEIKKIIKNYKILIIQPKEIDEAIDGNSNLNLNWLEARKTAEILNELELDKAIIDCPSPNITAYKNYLKKLLIKEVDLIITHKAERFEAVAAASILAKVTRDSEIEKIKKEVGINFGSGYPSDERTVEFLEKHSSEFKNNGIFRKSWSTWQENERKKEQKKLDGF